MQLKINVSRVVRSSLLLAKMAAYLVSIDQLLCLAFLYGWRFLNKISLNWLLTLTTQPSTSKLSDNPESLVACLPATKGSCQVHLAYALLGTLSTSMALLQVEALYLSSQKNLCDLNVFFFEDHRVERYSRALSSSDSNVGVEIY